MRIAVEQHSRHGWRIAEIASDFALIDAWQLPATGALHELADVERLFSGLAPVEQGSRASRALFALRRRLGRWFGWDDKRHQLAIPGCEELSLVDRLPPDLRGPNVGELDRRGFRLVYRTPVESASEVSNGTVHAVRHLGWVAQPDGSYRGQLGVYVKTRGRLGRAYMAAIRPFRLLVVYPALIQTLDAAWRARSQTA